MRRDAVVWLGAAAWLGGGLVGIQVWDAAGTAALPPEPPASSTPAGSPGTWAVTMFVHPHCPCSRGGIAELGRVVGESPVPVAAEVVFVRPPGVAAGWERGESWEIATGFVDVRVRVDEGGAGARRAGAVASGHTLLMDPAGRVVFRGGLSRTPAGNAGPNAVRDWLQGAAGAAPVAPVSGCRLLARDDAAEVGE